MRVGFGEKFARASRHVRGAWQTKAEQRQKVSQRNQHFLAKRRSLLLSSVEPSTSARTKARVHASHGGPSRGIATQGARSEREPTAFGCSRARVQPASSVRGGSRGRVHLASDPLRRVGCLLRARGIHPARPRGSRRAVAAAYPTTAANKSTAQWRVHGRRAGPVLPRRPRGRGAYLRRALAEAKAGFGEDDPHAPPRATTSPSCTACRGGSTRPRSCTRSRRPRWRSTTALAPRRGRGGAQPGGVQAEPRRLRRRLRGVRRRGCEESRGAGPNHPRLRRHFVPHGGGEARGASTEPPPRS